MGNVFGLQHIDEKEFKMLESTSIKIVYTTGNFYIFGDDDIDDAPSQINIITSDGKHYGNFVYQHNVICINGEIINNDITQYIGVDKVAVEKVYTNTPGWFWGVYTSLDYKYTIYCNNNDVYTINTALYSY